MIVEADSLQWIVDDQPSGDRIGPDHEEPLRARVLGLIPIGGTFIDVGAHVGCYSLRAADRAAAVYAVEPVPETALVLERNCELNHIQNVYIYTMAAWDSRTTLALVSPNGFPRDASMRTRPTEAEGDVVAVRLDEIFRHVHHVDLIKVDVEGSDLEALEGMRGLLARLRPKVLIEDHSVLGYFSAESLQEKIASLNYQSELFGTYGGANYWLCRPKSHELGDKF